MSFSNASTMRSRRPRRRGSSRVGATALAAVALVAWTSAVEAAGHIDNESEYAACTALARRDAEAAFESALAWRDAGGGAPAQHCIALALIGLGQFAEAAARLETLAWDMVKTRPGLRADVLGQAGQAWLRARQAERADAALSAALDIDPMNTELLIDRALALATLGAFWEAIDDLNAASDLDPDRADVYAFRASAYRYLDTLELASEDVERALALAPGSPMALLERGNIRRMKGNDAGARADWLEVLRAAPGTPAADAAQANIERLDLKVE